MAAMLKTWSAAQTVTSFRAPWASGREKKMSRFEDKYIPNDKANGETKKLRYPRPAIVQRTDLTSNLITTVVTCINTDEFHNELATIEHMLVGVTTDCFHQTEWKP